MTAQQLNVDNIANNLANANTTGYKMRSPQFQDLLYQSIVQPGTNAGQQTTVPAGLQLGLGTRAASNEIIFTQGSLNQTGNPLDIAIQGSGFFQVKMATGQLAYTRDGSFTMDNQGNVVTSAGYPLQPAINIPIGTQSITIGTDGVVTVTSATNAKGTQVGQIQLADFINEEGLQPVGNNMLVESAASGSPQVGTAGTNGLGQIQQNTNAPMR